MSQLSCAQVLKKSAESMSYQLVPVYLLFFFLACTIDWSMCDPGMALLRPTVAEIAAS